MSSGGVGRDRLSWARLWCALPGWSLLDATELGWDWLGSAGMSLAGLVFVSLGPAELASA